MEQLQSAAEQGELLPNIDVVATATVLVGHQWSMVLMWGKGLLALEDFQVTARRSQLMSLIPLCALSARQQLETELNQ